MRMSSCRIAWGLYAMEEIYFDGKRFTRFGNYWRSARKFLHRAVWEFHYGQIPKGWHVHHKDENRENNDVSNLELVHGREHLSRHHKGHGRRPQSALDALPAWRASPAGQQSMSESGKRNAINLRVTGKFFCEQCGKCYTTKKTGGNRFCSNACKSAWRRATGLDRRCAVCSVCGVEFQTPKSKPAETCSRSCGRKLWLATPEGREHLESLASRKRRKE